MYSISKTVWVDDPAQPSRPSSTSDAVINVTNQKHLFLERGDGLRPPLTVTVRDPDSLGLESHEPIDIHEFVGRVLTACNLLLKEARLSTDMADTTPAEIGREGPQDSAHVEHTPGGMEYTVPVNLKVIMYPSVELCHIEELDEAQVLEVLGMIHTVYDTKNPSTEIGNIRESLKAYSRGIAAHYREEVFKGLFVALEKAVNFDNKDDDAKFEGKVRSLAGDPSLKISDFNYANNRLKHSSSKGQLSRQPDDTGFFNLVRRWRPVTVAIMLHRLREAVGSLRPVSLALCVLAAR